MVLLLLPVNHLLVVEPHSGGCVPLYIDMAEPFVVEIRLGNFVDRDAPFLAPLNVKVWY